MLRPPAIIVGDQSGTSWPAFHEKLCLVSVLELADHLPAGVHRFFRLHRSYGEDGRLSEEANDQRKGMKAVKIMATSCTKSQGGGSGALAAGGDDDERTMVCTQKKYRDATQTRGGKSK